MGWPAVFSFRRFYDSKLRFVVNTELDELVRSGVYDTRIRVIIHEILPDDIIDILKNWNKIQADAERNIHNDHSSYRVAMPQIGSGRTSWMRPSLVASMIQ